jgi:menaquinone-dependent protoporphyrinogen oxidase
MAVLVTYASKHGSTKGIAEAIGERLHERGVDAEVLPIRGVQGLEVYDGVVVGSGVYLGSWMKEAQAFLDRHAEALRRIPVWLFSSGPTGTDPPDGALLDKQQRRLDAVGARDHHVFGGALNAGELGFLERRVVKATNTPLGDFRDWREVERWADTITDPVLERA